MRLLRRDEVELIWTIDRSEVHYHIYELREGQLVRTPGYFEVPGWRRDAAEKDTPLLLDCFDRGGTFLGVFDAGALIGIGVVESARVGPAGDQMQLAYLYVSRAWRRRGVGMQLFEAAASVARKGGAKAVYVSSAPTENTVDFYLNRGCVLARPSPTPGFSPRSPTTSTSSIDSDARRVGPSSKLGAVVSRPGSGLDADGACLTEIRAVAEIPTPDRVCAVVVVVIDVQRRDIVPEVGEHQIARAVVDVTISGRVRCAVRDEAQLVDDLVRHDEHESVVAAEARRSEVLLAEALLGDEGDRERMRAARAQAAGLGASQRSVVKDRVELATPKSASSEIAHQRQRPLALVREIALR